MAKKQQISKMKEKTKHRVLFLIPVISFAISIIGYQLTEDIFFSDMALVILGFVIGIVTIKILFKKEESSNAYEKELRSLFD